MLRLFCLVAASKAGVEVMEQPVPVGFQTRVI
jgi:hypothetical protein